MQLAPHHMVKFVVNTSQRGKYMAKLLKVRDHEITRILMAVVTLSAQEISVKIVEAISPTVMQGDMTLRPRVIYSYVFKEKKPVAEAPVKIERRNC